MSEIEVFLVDSLPIVREGLRSFIDAAEGMRVIGSAADADTAVAQISQHHPTVVILDLTLNHNSGSALAQEIKASHPKSRVLLLVPLEESAVQLPAIQGFADGYLSKAAAAQELVEAIQSVATGRFFLDSTLAVKLLAALQKPAAPKPENTLTEREIDILRLVAQGLSNQEIAEGLVLSERTVRTHVSNILEKLDLANRTQAALYALRQGIAQLGL